MFLTIVLGILLCCLFVGTAAILIGRRGRLVDDHPICRRCGFDLFGSPGPAAVCSECGADLSQPRAVRRGNRARRPKWVWAGVFLAGPAALWLGGTAYLAARGGRVVRYEPAWLLTREAFGADPGRRSGAIGELTARSASGRLAAGQVDAVTARVLDRQADPQTPWDPRWGDFVESARASGRVPDAVWQQYLRQAVVLRLDVRPKVRLGDPVPMAVVAGPARAGTRFDTDFDLEVSSCTGPGLDWQDTPQNRRARHYDSPGHGGALTIDTRPGGLPFKGDMRLLLNDSASGGAGYVVQDYLQTNDRLATGRQHVRATFIATVRDPATFKPADSRGVTVDSEFMLLPPGDPGVRPFEDVALRPSVERALRSVQTGSRGGDALSLYLKMTSAPCDLCCDVCVVADGKEEVVDTIRVSKAKPYILSSGTSHAGMRDELKAVDVIFRPRADEAFRTLDIERPWAGTVVVKNVAILRPRAATSRPAGGPTADL